MDEKFPYLKKINLLRTLVTETLVAVKQIPDKKANIQLSEKTKLLLQGFLEKVESLLFILVKKLQKVTKLIFIENENNPVFLQTKKQKFPKSLKVKVALEGSYLRLKKHWKTTEKIQQHFAALFKKWLRGDYFNNFQVDSNSITLEFQVHRRHFFQNLAQENQDHK
jgi:hypothetical protein